jgi:hypothetical protein
MVTEIYIRQPILVNYYVGMGWPTRFLLSSERLVIAG